MRSAFSEWLKEAIPHNKKMVFITADFGYGITNELPSDRAYVMGPMEQTIIGIAAGMAMAGKRPIVYGITPFILERAFEQIKLDVDQQNVPVTMVCYADYPADGPTHSELNCPTMLDLFENVTYREPLNTYDVSAVMDEVMSEDKPAFVRLGNIYRHCEMVHGKLCYYG